MDFYVNEEFAQALLDKNDRFQRWSSQKMGAGRRGYPDDRRRCRDTDRTHDEQGYVL